MALSRLKVIEFAGLSPGPFAGLVLADNGASVTRIDRPNASFNDILCRGKRSIIIDSKIASGRELIKKMIASADVVIDPFRPGVMERLGLGPEVFLGDGTKKGLNEKLIYARIVGFPRTGPHKDMAGHDINYIALSGILSMLPGPEKPIFPLNLAADFAGGGIMCALGILLGLIERGNSGRGQVVDTNMVQGTRYMASFPLMHAFFAKSSLMSGPRGTNILDGGAPFYGVYTCKDGGWMSVGCLEPQFFKTFLEIFLSNLPQKFACSDGWRPDLSVQNDRNAWPKFTQFIREGFLTNTRDYWTKVFHGTDSCTVPVLTPKEAGVSSSMIPLAHPQVQGSTPLPNYSSSFVGILEPGTHMMEILQDMGLSRVQIQQLAADGALGSEALKTANINSKL